MKPLSEFSPEQRSAIRGVFFDVDDTLTSFGRLTGRAYTAMERLHDAGLLVVPVTGRPAGWCDHIARMWPVDAVVGENGAFWFRYDPAMRNMIRRFVDDAATRTQLRQRLVPVCDRILAEVPGCALASDQRFRETALAIDYCEDVPRLRPAAVERIAALMREAGLTAQVGSNHVNGWYGTYDRLAMTRALMKEAFATELDSARGAYLYVGDSPNDAPMFGYFPCAVGVANVREFAATIATPPAYVTDSPAGEGFVELVDALLSVKRVRHDDEL